LTPAGSADSALVTSANHPDGARSFWEGRARRVVRRVNVAWWLSAFLPLTVALCAGGAAVVLVARRHGLPLDPVFAALGVALGGGALVAWWFTRARRFSTADALVRLDLAGGLDARLAAAGALGVWPPPTPVDDGLRWRLGPLVGPPATALLLLAAAAVIPVTPAAAPRGEDVVEPLAWAEVESRVAALEQADLFEPQALEALRSDLAELRAQPRETWYGHASLEAADHLAERLSQALGGLGPDLARAERGLQALAELSGSARSDALARAEEEVHAAVPGLGSGAVPLRSDLLGQLRGLDYHSLSRDDAAALGRALAKGRAAAKAGGRNTEGNGSDDGEEPCPGSGTGSGSCDRDGRAGRDEPGRGGVTRGAGAAPLTLGAGGELAVPSAVQPLPRADLDHAALGDVVEQVPLAPDVRPTGKAAPAPAGAVVAGGSGGDTVWRDRVTPEERRFLQRYFK